MENTFLPLENIFTAGNDLPTESESLKRLKEYLFEKGFCLYGLPKVFDYYGQKETLKFSGVVLRLKALDVIIGV